MKFYTLYVYANIGQLLEHVYIIQNVATNKIIVYMYEKWHTKTYTNIFRVINIASKQDEIILDGLIMWLHSCNKPFFARQIFSCYSPLYRNLHLVFGYFHKSKDSRIQCQTSGSRNLTLLHLLDLAVYEWVVVKSKLKYASERF